MPWTPDDAERHTHKAKTPELKELWAKVANESLERDGDEGRAIREPPHPLRVTSPGVACYSTVWACCGFLLYCCRARC